MSRPTSPFKFLDAYGQGDRDIFFGREKETEDLYHALSGVKHLLVYGPSGAGKTSLIECGLRNQFSDADWFALTIRRGADMTGAVFTAINEALSDKLPLDPETKRPLDASTDFGQAIENLFGERYQPVYLLFDQFEELLISGSEEEKKDFFARLNQLIRYKVPCRVLLIMREEFIGHLSEFEPLCPSIFQHRFRVEKMRKENVKEVIRKTLDAPSFHNVFQVANSAQLADRILTRLPDKSREIELAHVQVFLSELWERAAAATDAAHLPPRLHEGLVREDDNLSGVLDSFLKKQLGELDAPYGKNAALETLAAMISERHTKLQRSPEELQEELTLNGISLQAPLPHLLRELERRRILRTLRAGGQTQYEISHDVLAQVVGKNLTEEMQLREKAREVYRVYEGREGLLSQEDLDYLRPFEGYLALPEGLKGRMRESEEMLTRRQKEELAKARRRVMWFAGFAMVAAAAAVVAWIYYIDAEEAKQNVDEALKEAIDARDSTGLALTLAAAARDSTAIALILAEEERRKADAAREEAVRARDSTAIALNQAAAAREEAKTERDIAVQTLKNLELANEDRVRPLLKDAHTEILNLRYEEAEEKIASAEGLDALKKDVSLAYMELVFWYGETGEEAKASELLKKAWALQNRTLPTNLSMRESLKKLDSIEYDSLMKRYYPDMVPIQGGKFMMGCDPSYDNDCRSYDKQVTRTVSDFQMARHETTWWQYILFCKATGHEYKAPGWGTEGNNPVVNVSWYDAVAYANWVSERMGLTRIIDEDEYKLLQRNGGYRLPSDAEWEYAARAGQKTVYAGSNVLDSVGWFMGSRTRPVGLKKPNAFGLYDMSGNVWEWCWDWFDSYPKESLTNYFGPEGGTFRVVRGGSWGASAGRCRAAYRDNNYPGYRNNYIGFRLVFVPQ
jgi:formylglycine-generating enzyme required for sulfatase activity